MAIKDKNPCFENAIAYLTVEDETKDKRMSSQLNKPTPTEKQRARNRNEKLQEEIKELKLQLKNYETKRNSDETEMVSLRQKLERSRNIMDHNYKKIEEKEKQIAQLEEQNEQLTSAIFEHENLNKSLQSDKDLLQSRCKEEREQIRMVAKGKEEELLKELHAEYQNQIKQLSKAATEGQEELRKDIIDREKTIETMKITEKEQELNYKKLFDGKENTVARYKKTILDHEKWIQTLSHDLKISQQRESFAKLQLDAMNTELSLRLGQLTKLEKNIKALKLEKDDLQTRLSSFAGDNLTRGNPSITDLADPNRPMKIGERYGELYDNDWTDAMEKVDTIAEFFPGKNESEIEEIVIHHLHRIVRSCYRGCSEMANRQVKEVVNIIGLNQSTHVDKIDVNLDVPGLKNLMAGRKRSAENFGKQLASERAFCDTMLDEWNYQFKHESIMRELIMSPFYEKCAELCWYMAIQDPVMYLDDDIPPGIVMDKIAYREFTKSGDTVVYVVWPALYLHKDGPLLYKGVVQVK